MRRGPRRASRAWSTCARCRRARSRISRARARCSRPRRPTAAPRKCAWSPWASSCSGRSAVAEWLAAGEPRIGLGCMRLSTERERDEARALETVHAALDAGVTVFDTAHAYGLDDGERGHNEALLGRALAA